MRCPRCATEIAEHQKFCHDCGAAISLPAPDEASRAADTGAPTEPIEATDTVTEPPDVNHVDGADGADGPGDPDDADGAATESIQDADAVTEPIEILATDSNVSATEPIALTATTEMAATTGMPGAAEPLAPPSEPPTHDAVPADAVRITAMSDTGVTGVAPVGTFAPPVTAEMPALFDGSGDLAEYPSPREPFRVRVVFLLALFGAAAMLMSIVADVIDIRTTRPAPGIITGSRTLDDLGSNLGLAGFVGTAVMVLGGLLACFGLRWGAGLAGGAGLALAGWAGLSIGLAELPIAIAQSITRTSSVEFTLRVTRDLGWWLVLSIGLIGFIAFLTSLRSIGTGGRVALNPMVAAVTAVAMVVLASGPLVPVNDAVFADNFRSVDPTRDLPAAFFAGRLGQVALIALVGVVGMLIVRSYGLGLAAGGVSVSLWLWVSSFAEIDSNPIGIADRNPGATGTVPHAVTTVGMVATLVLLFIAAALATYRLNRSRPG